MGKKLFALVMVLLLLLTAVGCASEAVGGLANAAPADKNMDAIYDQSAEAPSKNASESGAVQSRKLIRTMNLEAETDDLDGLLENLKSRVAALGGYIERLEQRANSYTSYSYRHASLTIRIPVADMDGFVEHVTGQTNITYRQESADDVTLTYVATESRMLALETEQSRLLELLAKAENMEDLLLIEKRLTEVRTELEEVTSQLRLYDNLVDFGTIHLELQQVTEFTDTTEAPTVWQRIGKGFVESIQQIGEFFVELFVWVASASPYLVALAAMILVIVLLIKRAKKKKSA